MRSLAHIFGYHRLTITFTWLKGEEQPLWYSWNSLESPDQLCLGVKHQEPYMVRDATLRFSYSLCARSAPYLH